MNPFRHIALADKLPTWPFPWLSNSGPGWFVPYGRLKKDEATALKTPVYLTFDDGPGPNTARLAAFLRERGILASFFFLGKNVKGNEAIILELERDGHTIGSHGFDHVNAWRTRPSQIEMDLEKGLAALSAVVSQPVRWQRPPFGCVTPWNLQFGIKNGLTTILWNINPLDYHRKSDFQLVLNRILKKMEAQRASRVLPARPPVILLHENGPAWNRFDESMPRFLDDLGTLSVTFEALP